MTDLTWLDLTHSFHLSSDDNNQGLTKGINPIGSDSQRDGLTE
jgi:hypothetical protein